MTLRHEVPFTRILLVESLLFVFLAGFGTDVEFLLKFGNDLINTSDHAFYSQRLSAAAVFSLGELNNLPVTSLYKLLGAITGIRIEDFAFLVNLPLLLVAYILLEKMHLEVTDRCINPILLLGLLPLLAYLPLINKDAFGVLFYVALAALLQRPTFVRVGLVVLLLPFRIQHIAILILSVAFCLVPRTLRWRFAILVLVYISLSIAAGYVSKAQLLFNPADTTGTLLGTAALTRRLNDYFYLGSLTLNFTVPLRYVYDLARSIAWPDSFVGLVIAAGRSFALIILFLSPFAVFKMIYWPPGFMSHRDLYRLSVVVSSFFLIWMVSPIIHYRYFLNILPLLILGISIVMYDRRMPWGDLAGFADIFRRRFAQRAFNRQGEWLGSGTSKAYRAQIRQGSAADGAPVEKG